MYYSNLITIEMESRKNKTKNTEFGKNKLEYEKKKKKHF